MQIIPAIDICGGKVVRLTRGDYAFQKIYNEDPVAVAREWEACGASLIHVVDLDGALSGQVKNFSAIEAIASAVKCPIEVGGGLRSHDIIDTMFVIGVDKVVLGTKAIQDEIFLREVVSRHPDKVVIAVDADGDKVRMKGWTTDAPLSLGDLLFKLKSLGISRINYTDISKDGTLEGFDFGQFKDILDSTDISVVAGGGITSVEDIDVLQTLESHGLEGVIVGKALYEKAIDLKKVIDVYEKKL